MAKSIDVANDPRNPQSSTEWQEAVDAAWMMLSLDSCYQYGLMTGPPVNVERCEWILAEGAKKRILPRKQL